MRSQAIFIITNLCFARVYRNSNIHGLVGGCINGLRRCDGASKYKVNPNRALDLWGCLMPDLGLNRRFLCLRYYAENNQNSLFLAVQHLHYGLSYGLEGASVYVFHVVGDGVPCRAEGAGLTFGVVVDDVYGGYLGRLV